MSKFDIRGRVIYNHEAPSLLSLYSCGSSSRGFFVSIFALAFVTIIFELYGSIMYNVKSVYFI